MTTASLKSPLMAHNGRYIAAVLIGVTATLLAVASLDWIINPFHRTLTSDQRNAFCDSAALGGLSAWFLKGLVFEHEKYDGIIAGSSKVLYIDPALYKYYRFVDGGVGAATPEFMYELLNAYAVSGKVKVAVLALDFFMFNEARFGYATDEQLAEVRDRYASTDRSSAAAGFLRSVKEDVPYLLSLKVFGQALVAQTKAGGRTPLLMPRGNLNISDWLDEMSKRERSGTRHIDRDHYDSQLHVLLTQHYTPYVFSDRRVHDLEKIRDLMAQRGIPVVALIDPVNEEDMALIDSLPAKADFERYRQEVKRVFPDAADFSGPEYADPKYYFDWDPVHFLPSTGAMLVNQELAKVASPDRRREYDANPAAVAATEAPVLCAK